MTSHSRIPVPSVTARVYRALLLLYPAEHRREYGALMVQLFEDLCQDSVQERGMIGLALFCSQTLVDVARTAVVEHLDEKGLGPMADIPIQIGRYKVKAKVGSSPNADLYRAVDPKGGRDVVVKVMKEDPDPRVREVTLWLHRQEAELLKRLDHPALPRYHDYVETEDRIYTVMEFIDGPDLLAVLEGQEDPLPEKDAIEWAVAVCDFLNWLHSQAPEPLVYRDMKPSNLMLDRQGRMRVIDFCIADRPGSDQIMVGTEGYAPPEQYRGVSDARTDVYALGATLHHLLTRRDPRKKEPFTFHEAPPRSLNPALSEELEAAIMKAVAYEPEDRYQSAEEMKAALLACLC